MSAQEKMNERSSSEGSRQRKDSGVNDSSTTQEDSNAAPPPISEKKVPLEIPFSHEELSLLQEEIHRLTQYSVICKIFGSRPNRQELKELLYAQLQVEAHVIKDVQLMGKGFYHIEFSKAENVRWLLATNPLDLRGAQAFFSEWYQGFNVADAEKRHDKVFRITAVFPRLPK
jgi:hypothetical protein